MDHLLTKGQLVVEKLGPLHWAAQGGHGEVWFFGFLVFCFWFLFMFLLLVVIVDFFFIFFICF